MTMFAYVNAHPGVNETEQLTGLLGHDSYDHVLVESNSGKAPSEWERLESGLKPMDVVVVFSLQTLGTSLIALGNRINSLSKQQVRLISIEEGLDTANQMSFYSAIQLAMINERTARKNRMDLAISQHKGSWGRPAVDEEVINCIESLAKKEAYSIREIARICNVSVGTAHKYVTEYRKKG